MFAAIKKEFRPQNAFEQGVEQWATLKQTRDVGSYMNNVMKLYYTQPLGSAAEYGFAFRGLKNELKGVIKRVMANKGQEYYTLYELRDLAKSAEIEKGNHYVQAFNKRPYTQMGMRYKGWQRIDQRNPITIGSVGVANKLANSQPIERRCGICNQVGHWTRTCRYKKAIGCWKYGGPHLFPQCTAPFLTNKVKKGTENQSGSSEQQRQKFLSLVKNICYYTTEDTPYTSLTYQVYIKDTTIIELALIDTEAQCSAMRADVFRQSQPIPKYIEVAMNEKPDMRGVIGKPLRVLEKAILILHAGGITTRVEAWIVDGIHPQLILGLPWIANTKPRIEWEIGTLIFDNDSRWTLSQENGNNDKHTPRI